MKRTSTVLTTETAADMLGVHAETIRRLARKGKLPCFKVGKDWRFQRDALLQWMEERPHLTPAPCLLVVDDDPGMRRLMHGTLEKAGYNVVTAANGREGLEKVYAHNIQLILLDLRMPEMTGPQFVAELKRDQIDIPIIIVTGYPDSTLMMEVNVQCPVMLIAKPIDKDLLFKAVRTTLEGTLSQKEVGVY